MFKRMLGSLTSKRSTSSEEFYKNPTHLTFVTWNIDGLHRQDLEDRTIAVIEEIEPNVRKQT